MLPDASRWVVWHEDRTGGLRVVSGDHDALSPRFRAQSAAWTRLSTPMRR